MKLAALAALMSMLLVAPVSAQYGYGSYGYGSYSVGRRLFSADSGLVFQQTDSTQQLPGRSPTGRSLQSYGGYSYGYGGGYGSRRRLLQTPPSYGYGYGYGY